MRVSVASLAAILLTASGFWIAEEAFDGRGLQLAFFWMVLAAAASIQRLLTAHASPGSRLNVADLGVALLAAGHFLSSLQLERAGGDLGAAWNLTMEWAGLASAWSVIRLVCEKPQGRSFIAETLLALTIGLATLGIWQHHVAFPRNAEWYQTRRAELDTALQSGSSLALREAEETAAEFRRLGIPLEGPSRVLWENRALYSTEPLGPFALANTLAALLVAGLILAVARLHSPTSGWHAALLPAVSLSILGYCLILTKSRSAWIGAGCGLLLLVCLQNRLRSLKLILRSCVVAAAAVTLFAGTAAFSGALDREVILESPKSFQYRLFYWSGTLQMLAERPVFGAGPGNFRQAYLPHKPDESSEEIRDPHNLMLEAWSSAGLVGLAGMLAFSAFLAVRIWSGGGAAQWQSQLSQHGPRPTPTTRPRFIHGSNVAGCLLAGFMLDTAWEWFSADSLEGKAADMLLLAGALIALLRRRLIDEISPAAGIAAAVGVCIHLFASGGFGVPTVMLALLVCAAIGIGTPSHAVQTLPQLSKSLIRGICVLMAIVFSAAAVWTGGCGIIPLLRSERALDNAAALASQPRMAFHRDSRTAREAFRSAVSADPRRVSVHQAWAEFETGQLHSGLQADSPQLSEILTAIDEACRSWSIADPASNGPWRLRAAAYRRTWEITRNPMLLKLAIADFEAALQRHPGEVEVWLEKAELEAAEGDQTAALASARRAEQLDAINHSFGHVDQYLSESHTALLMRLLGQTQAANDHNSQEIPSPGAETGQKLR
jgi:O-antigen ligase